MPNVETFFLVRHGETRLTGTFCGSTNPPLTQRGITQGSTVAQHLRKFPIDVCYSSPLLRAKQMAQIATERLAIPLITNPLLKEVHFGAWEGLRFTDIEKKWPKLAKRWAHNPLTARIPCAEPHASLRKRIKRFLESLRKQFPNPHVLIVAHGGPLSAIVLELLGRPDKEFANHIQPPGSVRLIEEGRMRVIC
jgi:broad specificity phosphatase PhoE